MERPFTLEQLIEILDAELILKTDSANSGVTAVCASDLMSDILSFGKRRALLLTGLINPQTIRTAEMVEIAAICFIRGKDPYKETVELAGKNGIHLLKTNYSMFRACVKLHDAGLQDCCGDS